MYNDINKYYNIKESVKLYLRQNLISKQSKFLP
jgi:hypothetical protein